MPREIPLSDASAAVLAEALLAEDAEGRAALLTEQLMADPVLIAWVVERAMPREMPIANVADVAAWLADHLLESLRWNDADRDDVPQDECLQYADRVAASLTAADLAASIASRIGDEAAEAAYLAAVLQVLEVEPREIGSAGVRPAVESAVAEARVILEQATATAEHDLAGCLARAAAARQAWLAPVSGAGRCLPELVARLWRLDELHRDFQEVLQREKLEAMAEFAAGAGHEINNPLAIISGRAQFLLKEEADPERRRELAVIHAQAKRAYEMIADTRTFARPPRPEVQTVELVALVDAVLADLQPQAAERAIQLERRGDGPCVLQADPAQISVAVHAVCRNAIEAIGRDGRVEVAVQCDEQNAEIRVADNGPGIKPEERRHLFDPFFSARQAGRGLGLGLSKCWRIVTAHGGRIFVESQPGQGATFTITLPRRGPGDER